MFSLVPVGRFESRWGRYLTAELAAVFTTGQAPLAVRLPRTDSEFRRVTAAFAKRSRWGSLHARSPRLRPIRPNQARHGHGRDRLDRRHRQLAGGGLHRFLDYLDEWGRVPGWYLVKLNDLAARLHVLFIGLNHSDPDTLNDRGVMRPGRHGHVGVAISSAVREPNDCFDLCRYDPISKLKDVTGNDLVQGNRGPPNVIVIFTPSRRAAGPRCSQRVVRKIPAFSPPDLVAQFAARPSQDPIVYGHSRCPDFWRPRPSTLSCSAR